MFIHSAIITHHTTSSVPEPHVVYAIKVSLSNGTHHSALRRYSEFVLLKEAIGDSYPLPPKRSLINAVIPSVWIDDTLLAERKAGLTSYLNYLLNSNEFQGHPRLIDFLIPSSSTAHRQMMSKQNFVMRNLKENGVKSPVLASYYPSWSAEALPPSKIDFGKLDILFYAFATPNNRAGINWDDGSQDILGRLVSAARQSGKGTKIVLSVGGWGGSYYFSQAVSNNSNRTRFVNALVEAVQTYGLNGIDIDWEYPNSPGSGNPHSSADAANFLSLLKLLRKELGPTRIISAAVSHLPWLGSNGAPLSNVAEYAEQMTYVNVMNYDVFGSSPNPGPNAPLGNLCGTSSQPQATAQAAFSQWIKAGMPASKLLLGLPTYGYVSNSKATKLSGSFAPSPDDGGFPPGGHPRNRDRAPPSPEGPSGDLSVMWGQQVAFHQLLSSGVLSRKQDGTYGGTNGFTMGWDDCSDTPFLFSTQKETVVTYDDTYSLADKAKLVKQTGMGGCFTWSLDQDDGMVLHGVIYSSLGK